MWNGMVTVLKNREYSSSTSNFFSGWTKFMILLLNIEIANALQNTQYTGIISKAKTNFKLKNKAENFNANSKSFFFY